jgi:hypothetical protein
MGFGYHQARAAGLRGIRTARSAQQVNRYIQNSKAKREAINALREAQKDGEWIPYILHRIEAGQTAQQMAEELYWMKRYSRMRAAGYSVRWCLRHHWR